MLRPEGLYEEFCARFPYAETEDQQRAIEEVLDDLASTKPMDRLVCGDVGFRQDKVALRAAFVAASSGKQVAVVTRRRCFADSTKRAPSGSRGLPVEVRQLSRLVGAGDRRDRDGAQRGTVDIVIGTHSLLSKSVAFGAPWSDGGRRSSTSA